MFPLIVVVYLGKTVDDSTSAFETQKFGLCRAGAGNPRFMGKPVTRGRVEKCINNAERHQDALQ